MADFLKAFGETIKNEGGYVHDPQDPGGETYKGIARKRNAKWPGWVKVDIAKTKPGFPASLDSDEYLQNEVKDLYLLNYWHKIRGDDITNQDIAESIFDFGVNAGPRSSSKMAQMAVGAKADGVIGPKTLELINKRDPETFIAVFALSKISRYLHIVKKRPESRKFFYGWIRRTMEES